MAQEALTSPHPSSPPRPHSPIRAADAHSHSDDRSVGRRISRRTAGTAARAASAVAATVRPSIRAGEPARGPHSTPPPRTASSSA